MIKNVEPIRIGDDPNACGRMNVADGHGQRPAQDAAMTGPHLPAHRDADAVLVLDAIGPEADSAVSQSNDSYPGAAIGLETNHRRNQSALAAANPLSLHRLRGYGWQRPWQLRTINDAASLAGQFLKLSPQSEPQVIDALGRLLQLPQQGHKLVREERRGDLAEE
jgi:hypothetical protein